MVDALHAAHQRVRRGGLVVDARPDASRQPRIIARGRVRAYLREAEFDREADAAVECVIARGLYRPLRRGLVWYGSRFADLAELEKSFEDTARYCNYEDGVRRLLLPYRRGPLTIRRAMKYQILARL